MKFVLPLYVEIPRKTKKPKKVWLNKNTERNLHYRVYSEAKHIFNELLEPQCKNKILPAFPVKAILTAFAGTGHTPDLDNYSITAKFGFDALKKFGVIPDDNINYITEIHYKWGGFDKGNGRIELEFLPI